MRTACTLYYVRSKKVASRVFFNFEHVIPRYEILGCFEGRSGVIHDRSYSLLREINVM